MLMRFVLSGAAMIGLTACATAQEAEVPGWLAKDFVEFTNTFEGHWDNDRHVFFASDAGMDPATIAPRQHIDIKRVVLAAEEEPDPSTVTFTASRTVEGEDPASLVHSFSVDPLRLAIRQTISAPGGLLPPKTFDCQVNWQREGGQFRGKASGSECETIFPRPVEGGPLDVTLTLSDREFWVVSSRGPNRIEARMRRARPFECWTSILRGAEHGDSGEGSDDWFFQSGVPVHDQGGEAVLVTDEEPARTIRLKLRDVDWPYGRARASLVLYIHEGDNERATSYAWTEESADRVAVNLRWIQASCTRVEDSEDD